MEKPTIDEVELPDLGGVVYEDILGDDNGIEEARAPSKFSEPALVLDDGYEFDPEAVPVFEELSQKKSTRNFKEEEAELAKIVGKAEFAELNISDKPKAPKTDENGLPPLPIKPVAAKSPKPAEPAKQTEQTANGEKTMSSMEKRLAQPFDMPGAYNPAELNAPPAARQTPNLGTTSPAANQQGGTANNTGGYKPASYADTYSSRTMQSREDSLNAMYAAKRQDYEKGGKIAKILGFVVIGIAALDFISTLTNQLSSNVNKGTGVVLFAAMTYCAVKFMKGSNKYRLYLGWLSGIDAIFGLYSLKSMYDMIDKLNDIAEKFTSIFSSEPAPTLTVADFMPYFILGGLEVIGYAAMAYFFLLDKRVSDFTTEE